MIMLRFAAAAAVGLALAVSLPATPDATATAAAPSCFYVSQIDNTRAADVNTLYVRVSGSKIYRFDMKAPCQGLQPTSETILLEPGPSGAICNPISVNLKVTAHGTTQRCLIGAITRLSPDEAASLPKAVTPLAL